MPKKNEYSLKDLSNIVDKYFVLIIAFAIVGGVVLGAYGKHKQTTTFTATRSILINHNYSRGQKNANSQVNADISLMPTYKELVGGRTIANRSYKLLSHKIRRSTTPEEVKSSIDTESQPQSLVMTIKATSSKKENAVAFANATAVAAQKELPKLQHGMGSIKVLSKASEENATSSTHGSVKKYALVGAALGLIVGMVCSFVLATWRHIL